MQLLIMGAPGAGKGTQAAKIVKKYNIVHVSTGDLFREYAKQPTEQGQLVDRFMKSGKLIPDKITNDLLEDRLQRPDCEDGFILDGYPRTLEQAQNLNVVLNVIRQPLTKVLNIHVPAEALIERAVGRRICKNCGATYHVKFNPPKSDVCDECGGQLYQRADDTAETMKKRLSVYEKSTRPLIDFYKQAGIYAEIDGTQTIDKVTQDVFAVLDALK